MVKTIQIEANKIKPNPFKKFINGGELDEETLAKLIEGYKQTTFHENLAGRRNKKGEIELIYGHHRLEACKRAYGENKKISIRVYEYDEFPDAKMITDMVRENMTHRGEDFKDMSQSIILVKKWLEGNLALAGVSAKKTHKEVTYQDIAKFLAINSKSLNAEQVRKYLLIEEGVSPDIKKKIVIGERSGKIANNKIGFEIASSLATISKKEQPKIVQKIIAEKMNKDEAKRAMVAYRLGNSEIKTKVREGSLKLSDVAVENLKEQSKQFKAKKLEKDSKSGKIITIEYAKLLKKAQVLVGEANTKIQSALIMLKGLQRTGVLGELEWSKVESLLKVASDSGEQYYKMAEELRKAI